MCVQYVLLVVTDQKAGRSKLLVRGDRQSGYHMDMFEKTVRELLPHKLQVSQPRLSVVQHAHQKHWSVVACMLQGRHCLTLLSHGRLQEGYQGATTT